MISKSIEEKKNSGSVSKKTIAALDKTMVNWLPTKCIEKTEAPKTKKPGIKGGISKGKGTVPSIVKPPKKKGFDNRKGSSGSKIKFVRLKSVSDSILLTNKISPKVMSLVKTSAIKKSPKKAST